MSRRLLLTERLPSAALSLQIRADNGFPAVVVALRASLFVCTYVGHFVERRAALAPPVGLGVKLHTVHAGGELLLGEKVVHLAAVVCHSAATGTGQEPVLTNPPSGDTD